MYTSHYLEVVRACLEGVKEEGDRHGWFPKRCGIFAGGNWQRSFWKLDVEYNLSKLLRNPSSCCDNIKGCDILANS